MKLKKLCNLKSNFIKFELIKLKILQKYSDKFTLKKKIEELEIFLKKALMIIFHFNKKRKRILFIGIPQKIQNQYKHKLKKTKHSFLPESYSTTDLLTNKFITLKNLKDNNRSHVFDETKIKLAKNRFLLKKAFDLIVIVNPISQLFLIKKEASKLQIPLIILTKEDSGVTESGFYLIPGELSDAKNLKNFFYLLLLCSIFTKHKPKLVFKKRRNNFSTKHKHSFFKTYKR